MAYMRNRKGSLNEYRFPHQLIMDIVGYHAATCRICGAELEDCAIEFLERIWHKGPPQKNGDYPPAWLHRCARNHVRDYRRALVRRQRRATCWPETTFESGTKIAWEVQDNSPTPELSLMTNEANYAIHQAIRCLQDRPRELFLRHYIDGEAVESLAQHTGRNPKAIRQALLRARRQLRALLSRSGLTENELRALLPRLPPSTWTSSANE